MTDRRHPYSGAVVAGGLAEVVKLAHLDTDP